MPGVKPEDLKVTATANAVSIRATTTGLQKQEKSAEPKGKKTGDYVRRERYSGEVTRVIDLPDAINPAKIKASYKHGVLTLEVPKVEEVTPRKIDIVVEE